MRRGTVRTRNRYAGYGYGYGYKSRAKDFVQEKDLLQRLRDHLEEMRADADSILRASNRLAKDIQNYMAKDGAIMDSDTNDFYGTGKFERSFNLNVVSAAASLVDYLSKFMDDMSLTIQEIRSQE